MTARDRLMPLMFFAFMVCSGCATTMDERGNSLLTQADNKLAAEDYGGAIASYSEFVTAMPGHAQTPRVRATQKALERLVAAQAAITRRQQTSDATRRELTERQAETDRLKAEVAKLRADLERLRNIDLEPPRPK